MSARSETEAIPSVLDVTATPEAAVRVKPAAGHRASQAAPAGEPVAGETVRRLLPWLVAVSFFMESLDMTILNTAVPTVAGALGVAPLSLKSALTSYTLSLALFIPLSGWIADRFGTRRVFGAAIAVFTLGSLLCGLSTSVPMLVASRIVQGVGGAMMIPVGRLALVRAFPKSEMLRVLSFVVIPGLIGPLVGPLAGGLISDWLHWRAVFLVNLPIGFVGLYLVKKYMPDYRGEDREPLDVVGFLLFGSGVALLSHALEVFGEHSSNLTSVISMIAAAVVLLAFYWRHARRHPRPLLNTRLFRHRTFDAAIVGGFVARLSIGGMPFLLPLYYQVGLGYSPVHAGLLVMPQPLAAITVKLVAPRLLGRFGYRGVLYATPLAIGVVIALFATVRADTPVWLIVTQAYAFGWLMSLQYTSLNTLVYSDLAASEAGAGSTIGSIAQQLAMSFGVAVASLITGLFLGGNPALQADPDRMAGAIRGAFLTLGVLSILSFPWFKRLRPGDGDNMTARSIR